MPSENNFLDQFIQRQHALSGLKKQLHTDLNSDSLSVPELIDKTDEMTSLFWCLQEVLKVCDLAMSKKPSRELALVKTKLQEAEFWLDKSV